MKTKTMMNIFTLFMITGFLAVSTPAFSGDKAAGKETKAAAATEKVQAEAIEVRGVIEKSNAGMFVFDGNQTYYVVPDKSLGTDLDKLTGKLVKLSGTLQKSENGPAILVTQAKEAS